MISSRLFVLVALACCACSSSSYREAREGLPALAPNSGRIVFLGDNVGHYGLLEGPDFEPVIAIGTDTLDVGRGTDICFVAVVPAGKLRISVDGVPHLDLVVDPGRTKYVEMQLESEANETFSLRNINFRMSLRILDESKALARLDELTYLGVAR